ncbi:MULTISPECIES: dihydroneopterin aldolase [Flagellimonas]|uniref:7,8-dihydroneopterin aldolase n=2 Tax=Flagellimonas TaxID=444459 RepID=A0A3A1NLT0_9FLAO|nr:MULTISPECIES: dihydroneopterin aldolase [Allomuricauda]RIV44647.1 dihydroneopterin aldolase [Allomuricauda maritima]RIV72607.1 dihydroneopterin aldolase [Allomuricauda aequoris]TXJ94709.1 dihydroneopterin aldolase [Allomuricauda maritima]TXK05107.1 dihydroneopterin aldolase [Allomuricauda aequoris]
MGKIKLKNIRIHSNHGCLKEEMLIGSDYRVDLEVTADLARPALSDKLDETVDYVHLNNIVKEEMSVRSNLLEHVAKRIIDRILEEILEVTEVEVEVAKINPPIGGDVESVSVKLGFTR